MRNITKIKLNKFGGADISFADYEPDQEEREVTESSVKCMGAAHPDLHNALKRLEKTVRNVFGINTTDEQIIDLGASVDVQVYGVDFTASTDTHGEGIIVKFMIATKYGDAKCATPRIIYGSTEMSRELTDIVGTIKEEALCYIEGKRAQLSLFNCE